MDAGEERKTVPFGLFGASGAIGRSVIEALRAAGTCYRVVGRDAAKLRKELGGDPLAEIAEWNPDDPESVRAAARGVDTLIYLVGVPYTDFHLHPELIRKTLDGAMAGGVRRFVLIGTLYPFGRAQAPRIAEDHPREPHTYKGRMRREQEDILLSADADGRIRAAIIRLPDFYGPGVDSSYVADVFAAAAEGRRAKLVGPVDVPHEFLYVPDAGPVILRLAQHDGAWGRAWHLGGAGTITQRELARQAFELAGQKPRLMVAGPLMLRLAAVFDPFMREVREMHYLWTQPLVMDDSALHNLLGDIHKTPYAEGIRASLDAAKARAADKGD